MSQLSPLGRDRELPTPIFLSVPVLRDGGGPPRPHREGHLLPVAHRPSRLETPQSAPGTRFTRCLGTSDPAHLTHPINRHRTPGISHLTPEMLAETTCQDEAWDGRPRGVVTAERGSPSGGRPEDAATKLLAQPTEPQQLRPLWFRATSLGGVGANGVPPFQLVYEARKPIQI